MGRIRKLIVGCVSIAVVTALLFVTGVVQLPLPSGSGTYVGPVTVTRSECIRPSGFILVIADLSGFNDSVGHGAPANPWPVVRVKQGDFVRFVVCNLDKTQPHGFAIQTYFDRGVVLGIGDAFRVEFQATLPGTFVMYCNIFCTIHIFMVGRLIVSSS
jgi:FtsP/CotA-like multicopper oxidase with cupredoxin domain